MAWSDAARQAAALARKRRAGVAKPAVHYMIHQPSGPYAHGLKKLANPLERKVTAQNLKAFRKYGQAHLMEGERVKAQMSTLARNYVRSETKAGRKVLSIKAATAIQARSNTKPATLAVNMVKPRPPRTHTLGNRLKRKK